MSPWEVNLVQFIDDCAEGSITEPTAALTNFAALARCAPPEFAGLFDRFPDEARVAKLIEADAFVTASMEMVGPYCGILLTRSATGTSSGLVTISNEVEEGSFFCEDPAVAVLGAFARALLALGSDPMFREPPTPSGMLS